MPPTPDLLDDSDLSDTDNVSAVADVRPAHVPRPVLGSKIATDNPRLSGRKAANGNRLVICRCAAVRSGQDEKSCFCVVLKISYRSCAGTEQVLYLRD